MAPIPAKLRKELAADPFMKVCIYNNEFCEGRVEWEHAFEHAGHQVQEWWAIVPCCTYHHRGAGLDKQLNQLAGLTRYVSLYIPYLVTGELNGEVFDEINKKYPRTNWAALYIRLNKKVGVAGLLKVRKAISRSYASKASILG